MTLNDLPLMHTKLREAYFKRLNIVQMKDRSKLTSAERYQAFCEEKPWRWEAKIYEV